MTMPVNGSQGFKFDYVKRSVKTQDKYVVKLCISRRWLVYRENILMYMTFALYKRADLISFHSNAKQNMFSLYNLLCVLMVSYSAQKYADE
jgi:hypothetical protein